MQPLPLSLRPIAFLRTPFAEKFGIPRQGALVPEAEGRVEFTPEFSSSDFVRGLEAFSHLWLITGFHQSPPWNGAATVRPPRLGGNERVGVFASRSPNRPNALSLTLVQLLAIETSPSSHLRVACVDAVDGSPVYDIKPYLPWCESIPDARSDWAKDAPTLRAESSVLLAPEIEAKLHSPELVALIRRLLSLELQPAYHADPTRTYGMTIAGWNIRWRRRAAGSDELEVTEAERVG